MTLNRSASHQRVPRGLPGCSRKWRQVRSAEPGLRLSKRTEYLNPNDPIYKGKNVQLVQVATSTKSIFEKILLIARSIQVFAVFPNGRLAKIALEGRCRSMNRLKRAPNHRQTRIGKLFGNSKRQPTICWLSIAKKRGCHIAVIHADH